MTTQANPSSKSHEPAAVVRPAGRLRAWCRRLLTVLASIACGAAIAEIAFWLRDDGAFPHLNVYVADPKLGVRLRPGATQRVRFGSNPLTHVRINARGLRGAELLPSTSNEVLVVGDSQVFGLGVEESDTFAARLANELHRPVVNAGVPTYGPIEYNALLREMVAERKPKTVFWVVNVANDLFEADRPNVDRHKVWDGWAVRAESAPVKRRTFPGRDMVFGHSHAVFALRKLWYDRRARGPELDDKGFASEGTFRDIVGLAAETTADDAAREAERIRRAHLYHDEIAFAERRALAAQVSFELLVANTFGGENGQIVRAARASPGDIVAPGPGEEARPIVATAVQIKQGAELRAKYEAELRAMADKAAASAADADRAKSIRERLDVREATAKRLAELRAAPAAVAREHMPIADRIKEAKAICDEGGAELVVVALPLDVQVSGEEWKKYGASPIDMESTKVLLADLVATAEEMGARGFDATAALAAAEPGAFLDRDLHMTPKGHAALARALASALSEPAKPRRVPGLPLGRSRTPRPEDWNGEKETTLLGSTKAGCETKRVREWLRVTCRKKGAAGAMPTGVALVAGGHGDAIAASWDGVTTLVAPVLPSDRLEADFFWTDRVQRLVYEWPADAPVPLTSELGKGQPARDPPKRVSADAAARVCGCYKEKVGAADCSTLVASGDPDCVRTYSGDCGAMLACAAGDFAFPPRCETGFASGGATERCRKICSSDADCAGAPCAPWQGLKLCGQL